MTSNLNHLRVEANENIKLNNFFMKMFARLIMFVVSLVCDCLVTDGYFKMLISNY